MARLRSSTATTDDVPRVVVLTRNWKLSQIALAPLLRDYPHAVVGIVFSTGGLGIRRTPRATMARRTLSRSGLRYFLYQSADFLFPLYLSALKRLRPRRFAEAGLHDLYEVARERGYRIVEAPNVNAPSVVRAVERLRPDVILSVYFDQLIGDELIEMPPAGCLNFHPSDLPKYRGVNPMFWATLHDETEIGVTFHFMDAALDRGPIALQRHFDVSSHASVMQMELHGAKLAGEMILELVSTLAEGESLPRRSQKGKKASYFSFPDKPQVNRLREGSVKLFSLSDIFAH